MLIRLNLGCLFIGASKLSGREENEQKMDLHLEQIYLSSRKLELGKIYNLVLSWKTGKYMHILREMNSISIIEVRSGNLNANVK